MALKFVSGEKIIVCFWAWQRMTYGWANYFDWRNYLSAACTFLVIWTRCSSSVFLGQLNAAMNAMLSGSVMRCDDIVKRIEIDPHMTQALTINIQSSMYEVFTMESFSRHCCVFIPDLSHIHHMSGWGENERDYRDMCKYSYVIWYLAQVMGSFSIQEEMFEQ